MVLLSAIGCCHSCISSEKETEYHSFYDYERDSLRVLKTSRVKTNQIAYLNLYLMSIIYNSFQPTFQRWATSSSRATSVVWCFLSFQFRRDVPFSRVETRCKLNLCIKTLTFQFFLSFRFAFEHR